MQTETQSSKMQAAVSTLAVPPLQVAIDVEAMKPEIEKEVRRRLNDEGICVMSASDIHHGRSIQDFHRQELDINEYLLRRAPKALAQDSDASPKKTNKPWYGKFNRKR